MRKKKSIIMMIGSIRIIFATSRGPMAVELTWRVYTLASKYRRDGKCPRPCLNLGNC